MIQFFCRRFRTRPDGSHDESGLAMISAITVVMLMTIIPLAIVQGAIAQLPLARHDQDRESARCDSQEKRCLGTEGCGGRVVNAPRH